MLAWLIDWLIDNIKIEFLYKNTMGPSDKDSIP